MENFYTSAAEERKKVFGSDITFRFMIYIQYLHKIQYRFVSRGKYFHF